MIGHIPNIKIGTIFPNRKALHDAEIHRGLQRGIAPEGASIVLSGGYVDDEDMGDVIIYTGEGGRDQNTGKQIKDQTLTGGNLALAQNYVNGNPIRVNRGHQLDSVYAPTEGYRYDGLYRIDEYWSERGKDGCLVWRYRLVRLDEQSPLSEVDVEPTTDTSRREIVGNEQPGRTNVTVSRVIRNTQIGNEIKSIYGHYCQICSTKLVTPSGPYAECCHIRPLGKPHSGPDTLDNVLCLCPNCHVLFDSHAIHIDDNFTILETGKKLIIKNNHRININNLRYHKSLSAGLGKQ